MASRTENLFCRQADLGNESSVETFFAARMLAALGYSDSQIKTKESIEELSVSRGRKRVKYRPDYVIMIQRRPRVVIDAKATTESLDDWVGQCGSYCHEINKRHEDNPAELFVLTNGVETRVYRWDSDKPLLTLVFADFEIGNVKYEEFQRTLSRDALLKRARQRAGGRSSKTPQYTADEHGFKKEPIDAINAAFGWCHQHIYRKDNMSQAAAFMEFVKLMFLKLLSDKEVHAKHPQAARSQSYAVPSEDVPFSTAWIEKLESSTSNPVADVAFVKLRRSLEDKIHAAKKKRIFEEDEELSLSAETIKGVVSRLEHMDLYSIDADLNGRLFETFLNSTMRGRDLGQYFTPRSIVKLAYSLAGITIGRNAAAIPTVLDPCCGSGGFLIDVLWDAWAQIDANASLTAKQKQEFKEAVATEKLIGIDVGRDPHIARIARINMYLHGDGGSRIYEADSLDKALPVEERWSAEKKKEVEELRKLLTQEGGCADLILTNPPFSKSYESKHEPDKKVLSGYELARLKPDSTKLKPAVKSNVLFLERYYDFLKPGGRVVAVVDDSVLGGNDYREVRAYLRRKFVVEAVVSLPGDAFQRSLARVKTSLIALRKKDPGEEQAACFMYYCNHIGLDDSPRQRSLPSDRLAREKAAKEIAHVAELWRSFRAGGRLASWMVAGDKLTDRLDVKSCLPQPRRLLAQWKRAGRETHLLREIVTVFDEDSLPDGDVIETGESSEVVTFLRVRYDGVAEAGEEKATTDVEYELLFRVHANDIVISHINAVHGAIAVVPPELDGPMARMGWPR